MNDDAVRRRVQRTARLAQQIGCAHVGKVLPAYEGNRDAPEFFQTRWGIHRRLVGGEGTTGWLVEVWPGEGCETAIFGLIRHRPRIPGEWHRTRRPRWNSRWELHSWCKTYYAAEHGIEHFVQCHERVVRLLELWRGAGVRLQVRDESGFWKTRSREALAAQIGDLESFRRMAQHRVWS